MMARWATLFGCSLIWALLPMNGQAQPLTSPQSAASQTVPRPFRVVFNSTAACRDAREFVRQLLRRTTRLRPAQGSEPALVFVVSLSTPAGGVRGRLWISEPAGTTSERDVPGNNCHEVLSAMALIGALTVDPLADPGPLSEEPPSTETPLAEPTVEALPQASHARPAERRGSAWSAAVGQRLTTDTAIAPGLSVGLSAHVQVSYETSGWLDPMLRVAGHFAKKAVEPASNYGDAEFEWAAVRVSVCPLRLPEKGSLGFRPCGFFDVGRLAATGYNTRQHDSPSVFWTATGLELSFDAEMVGPLHFGAEAGLTLPLLHDTFFFRSGTDSQLDQDVHTVPKVGLTTGVGLQAYFF